MSVEILWLGHASFIIEGGGVRIAIDPWKTPRGLAPVDVVLVSHSHFDHYSADDVARVKSAEGVVCGPVDVHPDTVLKPGESCRIAGVTVTGVPAYNIGKQFHPRSNDWLGFVVELDGRRIYYAGDTDRVPEMQDISGVDVALLPVGGTYTMDAAEAAEAAEDVGCRLAIPYHWGDVVGNRRDADRFAKLCLCEVRVLEPGQSVVIS